MKFQSSEKFALEINKILVSLVSVSRNNIFCEFGLLIEFPKKCTGGCAVTGRRPGYSPAIHEFWEYPWMDDYSHPCIQ